MATCSGPVSGHVGSNLVENLPDLETEDACRAVCQAEAECHVYTYYTRDDPTSPGSCFLLSRLTRPVQYCDHCQTGAGDCSECTGVFMEEDGGSSSWGMVITSTNSTVTVTAVAVGTCDIVLVAVGGGGAAGGYGNSNEYGGGGGSGYVTWKAVPMKASLTLEVEVGSSGVGSLVRGQGGELLLEAPPGKPGETGETGEHSSNGGAGYSGGGGYGGSGYGGGAGGSGGGDGEAGSSGSGGQGSGGPALKDIPIMDFILRSPPLHPLESNSMTH